LLVGGAITILKNMSSSVGMIIPNIWENKSHVPNHQPAMELIATIPSFSMATFPILHAFP